MAKASGQTVPFAGLDAAPPVFFCSVEPASAAQQSGEQEAACSHSTCLTWRSLQHWSAPSRAWLEKIPASGSPLTATQARYRGQASGLRCTAVMSVSSQTVLSGMGELHLEVVLHRLRHDFRVDCSLGTLQVAYREAPTTSTTQSSRFPMGTKSQ